MLRVSVYVCTWNVEKWSSYTALNMHVHAKKEALSEVGLTSLALVTHRSDAMTTELPDL